VIASDMPVVVPDGPTAFEAHYLAGTVCPGASLSLRTYFSLAPSQKYPQRCLALTADVHYAAAHYYDLVSSVH